MGCEIGSGADYRDGPYHGPDFCLWAFRGHDPVRDRDRGCFCHHLWEVFSNYAGFLQELVSVSLSAEP